MTTEQLLSMSNLELLAAFRLAEARGDDTDAMRIGAEIEIRRLKQDNQGKEDK